MRLSWKLILVHLEIVLILTQDRCIVCAECTSPGNYFGRTRWNSYVTWVVWNLISVRLATLLVSAQVRCTVCAKRTIASEIILDTPDGLLCYKVQLEACFDLFGDSANFDAR
jgi:hypothetical protein